MAQAIGEGDLGHTVQLQDGRRAIVRYVGNTQFSTGTWVGVELDGPTGKNDGAVQGKRYFECPPGHGMFVRPATAVVVDPVQVVPNGKLNGTHVARSSQRPDENMVKRQSLAGPQGKRQSVSAGVPKAEPKAAPASRLARSPPLSPPKPVRSTTTSGPSAPRIGAPSSKPTAARPSVGNRLSMGPPAATTRASRPSIAALGAVSGKGSAISVTSRTGSRPSLNPRATLQFRKPSSRSDASAGSEVNDSDPSRGESQSISRSPLSNGTSDGMSPNTISPLPSLNATVSERVNSARLPSPTEVQHPPNPKRAPVAGSASGREIDDLKTKLRMMEKKRMEDRDKLRSLERIQAERDKFEAIIQKLQAKYQPQQQEIAELRKRLRDAEVKAEEAETQQAENDVALEMATLDREMAEETAEVLKTELDTLKQKTEELELEVEVLREENQTLGEEINPEDRTSQGWLQMERNNERLREALIRLRDLTKEQEAQLQAQVQSLEEDVQELSGVKEQYEATKEKLTQSEATIEELRQQLDIALGAEEMIEELTESNMNMREQIDELKATIEDLESLKELNDELEANHIETEKQMQEEIDYREMLLAEQSRRALRQDETIQDYDYTIARFRELVTELQSDLEDMRASQQITETEAEELNHRSRAMMDLNMKLQASASKTQVKTIDLELRRLDAQQAAEHLAIVQLFLPEPFQAERDPILALLRFRRVAFKAQLLHGFVKERVAGQAPGGREDDMFAGCDVLDKLTCVSAMCDRFITCINSSSIEQFAKFESALYELEPVERALNGWLDGLKRDELDERQVAAQLQRSIALMSHLAEVHITDGLENYATEVHMRAMLTQSYLENTATAMSRLREMVQNQIPTTEENEEMAREFARKTDAIIANSRSAKVIVSKAVRALEELLARSLSLSPDTLPLFELCEAVAKALAECSRGLGEDLFLMLTEEGLREARTYGDVQATISGTTSRVLDGDDKDSLSTLSHNLQILIAKLGDLNNLASDLSQTIEFERSSPPWALRARELQAAEHIPEDVEEQVRALKDALHETATQLKLRDQTLEESDVKIELLEARTRDASKKTDKILELERSIAEARRREQDLSGALEARSRELQHLESEKERWQEAAERVKKSGSGGPTHAVAVDNDEDDENNATNHPRSASTKATLEIFQREINHLQSTVRYLRYDNDRLRYSSSHHHHHHHPSSPSSSTSSSSCSWLHTPLRPAPPTKEQKRAHLLAAEATDVIHEMLRLVTSTTSSTSSSTTTNDDSGNKLTGGKADPLVLAGDIYDLRRTPTNRLAWRPAKSTPQWHVGRQREQWESWREWMLDVSRKADG